MNKVCLVGRLTKDPDIRVANSGTSTARLTLAVDRRFKTEGGPTADFIGCVAFGKTAEFIEKHFKRGMRMGATGRIQTGSYEKDGQRVYTTDVLLEEVEFVESKGSQAHAAGNSEQSSPADSDGFMDIPDGIDEELPFA